jgi:hypothetical protein
MNKILLAFLIVALLPFLICAAQDGTDEYDVRQLKWGMSPQEVKQVENLQNSYLSASGNLVLYKNAKLFENDIIITFCFDSNSQLQTVNYESLKINSKYDEKFLDALKEKYEKKEEGKEEGKEKSKEIKKTETTVNYLKIIKNKKYLYKYPEEAREYAQNDYQFDLKGSNDYDLRKNLGKAKIWKHQNTVILYNPIRGNSSLLIVQYINKDLWEKSKTEYENLVNMELKEIISRKAEAAEEKSDLL